MIRVIDPESMVDDVTYLKRRALRLYIDGHKASARRTAKQALLLEDAAVIYRECRTPSDHG